MGDGVNAIRYILNGNIPGALVECGVAAGDMEEIWMRELIIRRQVRDIVMYDTFAGLTKPSEFDYTRSDAIIYKMESEDVLKEWESKKISDNTNAWCYTPLEQVKQRLERLAYPKNKLHYIVGDVMETLKYTSNIPKNIAILRLDTDWYESSKFELETLYPRVVKGGLVIFDDYYHWDGQRRATDDYFAVNGITPVMYNIGNGKTGYIIKQ